MSWSSPLNAEVYDRYTHERPLYQWLNRRLVHHARVSDAQRLLDLGCGTGATTRACLRRLPVDAELVAVDANAAMAEVARRGLPDPRVRVKVLAGEQVSELDGPFDCVVSNAALWLVHDLDAVFAGLADCTAPHARVTYNIPEARLAGAPAEAHPFQLALQDELRQAGSTAPSPPPICLDGLHQIAARHGFEVVSEHTETYRARQHDFIALMAIPAMLGRAAPDLSEQVATAALQRAQDRSDPDLEVSVPWRVVVLQSTG